jgi:hypothetical protein
MSSESTTSATSTRSTISISVPDDRRDDERWPPVLVRFPLGAPRDDVLRSLASTRISSFMGMGPNANTTLQRGVVVTTPAARYSGVAALPSSSTTSSSAEVAANAVGERKRARAVESGERYVVARFDPAAKRITLVDVGAPFTLQPHQHLLLNPDGNNDDDNDDDEVESTLNDVERQRRLVDKFGSHRRARRMTKESLTVVRLGTSMSGGASAVASLESRAAELPVDVEARAEVGTLTDLPAINRETTVPSDVFDIKSIITANVQQYLSAEFETARERAAALGAARATARRFGGWPGPLAEASEEENAQLKVWHDACEQLGSPFLPLVYADASFDTDRGSANRAIKTAHFLALLVLFHRGLQRDAVRSCGRMASETGVPYVICQHFAEHYCDPGASDDDKPRFVRSGSKKDKLINHALVLMLFLSNFEVALTDVVQVLMVPATKARDHLRYVSCTRTAGGVLLSKLDRQLVMRTDDSVVARDGEPYRESYKLVAPFREAKPRRARG